MRYVLSALVLSVAMSGPGFAGEISGGEAKQAARVLYICDNSAMTRRGFAREHGAVEFVTAEAAAASKGQVWAAPKCVTPTEARRLKQLAEARRQVASIR